MTKVPSLSYRTIVRALQRDGWIVVRQKGSHIRLQKRIGDRTLKLNGMTQEALAAQAGLSSVALGRYERSERFPTIDVVERIASDLGCGLGDLLHDETGPRSGILEFTEERLHEAYNIIGPGGWKLFVAVLADREGRTYLLQQARFWLSQKKEER